VIASIHRRLYQEESHENIDLGDYLEELGRKTFEHLVADGQASFSCKAERGIRIPLEKGIPMALVVTEILTNSLKYAFPGDRTGTVSLKVCRRDGGAVIHVADDGVGMTKGSSGTGLGTKIIDGLSRQVSAELHIETGADGTLYDIRLPLD
jgi:two-component sensor histidine kinase